MVDDPVEVTLPYQISSSAPTDPANCTPLVQVVTPPPETDVRVPARPLGEDHEHVTHGLRGHRQGGEAVPTLEVKLPTAVIDDAGATKVKWSAGLVALEVPPAAVTVTSTVPADSAGEVDGDRGGRVDHDAGARHGAELARRWPR